MVSGRGPAPRSWGTRECARPSWLASKVFVSESDGFCWCQPAVRDCGSEDGKVAWHLTLCSAGSLQQAKGCPPKRGQEPVVEQESLPSPGTQVVPRRFHALRKIDHTVCSRVHSKLTIINGMDGLALSGRPERRRRVGSGQH